jgi:hypothetical protein
MNLLLSEQIESLSAACGEEHSVLSPECPIEGIKNIGLVIDNQDRMSYRHNRDLIGESSIRIFGPGREARAEFIFLHKILAELPGTGNIKPGIVG